MNNELKAALIELYSMSEETRNQNLKPRKELTAQECTQPKLIEKLTAVTNLNLDFSDKTFNYSLFIVHCSLFIVHCSLFIVHCSLFIVHDKEKAEKSLTIKNI